MKPEIPPNKVKSAIPFCEFVVSDRVFYDQALTKPYQSSQVDGVVLATVGVLHAKRVSRICSDAILSELVRNARHDGPRGDAGASDAERPSARSTPGIRIRDSGCTRC